MTSEPSSPLANGFDAGAMELLAKGLPEDYPADTVEWLILDELAACPKADLSGTLCNHAAG
ncbi:hypothetical protein FVF58_04675 [Paraburkholderia panacisoli]|uniref:Uncharacterized protein n=1 Tax=Paraburkholderia panacisoli TaxID=2603818 RepID=A0A5B0HK85_9BURK|nr:hypothetical protein [Paraburkholderia panacisoli]KAA1015213.1 hypothetical protein FVF58_04675 [Paraburkholderia panacisoli]